jgi:hypothetical protein
VSCQRPGDEKAKILTLCTARMMEIMQLMGEGDQGSEVALTRVQVLSEFLI